MPTHSFNAIEPGEDRWPGRLHSRGADAGRVLVPLVLAAIHILICRNIAQTNARRFAPTGRRAGSTDVSENTRQLLLLLKTGATQAQEKDYA
jgi:hypothetical protein